MDADIIIYKAVWSSTTEVAWDDEGPVSNTNFRQAVTSAEHVIQKWRERSRAKAYFLCFSSREGNFRKLVDPNYKSNRKDQKRPAEIEALGEYLREKHPSMEIPLLEADDVMGIWATNGRLDKPVMVTIDKDLQSIPALYLNPDKGTTRPTKMTTAVANRFWLTQTLTGDVIDGYKGAPGIGPVRAAEIIGSAADFRDAWSRVVRAFEARGLTEEDAIRNARLARILRARDWDEDTRSILLWHPTKSETLPTTRSETSKSSMSSSSSSSTTARSKRSASGTSSSTSLALRTKGRRRKTSGKRSTTSKGSSKASHRGLS